MAVSVVAMFPGCGGMSPASVSCTAGRAGTSPAKVPYTMRGSSALVAQRIEHLTTDQKVGGSSPSERASQVKRVQFR
jgi:hypothetical protein